MAMIKWKGKWYSISVSVPLLLVMTVVVAVLLVPLVRCLRHVWQEFN